MDIQQRRKELKMTQVEVAKKVGVSLQAYRWWEQGVGNPTPENLKKLKKALQIKD